MSQDTDVPARLGRGVIEGAFHLLETLSWSEPVGLSALARATGIPKATTYRLLDQLAAIGAVERQQRGYQLGAGMRSLTSSERAFRRLRGAGSAPCRRLATQVGASIGIAALTGDRVTCVVSYSSAGGVLHDPGITSYPRSTAAGLVLLAEHPEANPPSSMSDAQWRRVRADIRHVGVAFDNQTIMPGLCCVAAPIRRAGQGRPVASVSAMVAANAIPQGLADRIRLVAAQIGRNLAVQPGRC